MKIKSEEIRAFIINHVDQHPREIVRLVAENFSISRQAVNRHMKALVIDEVIHADGKTRERVYSLKKTTKHFSFKLDEHKEEDSVWRNYIEGFFFNHKETINRILYYGFTEMFNNAIDHSGGSMATVILERSAKSVSIIIADDGVGVFEKIRSRFGLADQRAAILELSKGKLTTDPSRHSGQGIFFHVPHVRQISPLFRLPLILSH